MGSARPRGRRQWVRRCSAATGKPVRPLIAACSVLIWRHPVASISRSSRRNGPLPAGELRCRAALEVTLTSQTPVASRLRSKPAAKRVESGMQLHTSGPGSGTLLSAVAFCAVQWLTASPLAAAQPAGDAPKLPPSPFSPTLPALDGDVVVVGLKLPAKLERDAQGIVTITAACAGDALLALGYAHAQDRYFQMDLSRRYASGELAALTGPLALDFDKQNRPLGLRAAAEASAANLPPADAELLAAYVRGVNAGLASLPAPPPEYGVLGAKPEVWTAADCGLMMLSFASQLHGGAEGWQGERTLGQMKELVHASVYDFVTSRANRRDCPVIADSRPVVFPAVPGPQAVDTRKISYRSKITGGSLLARGEDGEEPAWGLVAGSNNFAVAGSRTADGRAVVCGDPHLQLSAPNVWYRATLKIGKVTMSGVTAPGLPGLIIGGVEGKFAWALTNTQGDFMDLVVLEPTTAPGAAGGPEAASEYYVTPTGPAAVVTRTEKIDVRGGAGVDITVRSSVWGPIVGKDHKGRDLALKWTAMNPELFRFDMLHVLDNPAAFTSLDDILTYLAGNIDASQNVVVATNDGRIGYILSGAIPKRVGFDGSVPTSWADGARSWNGFLSDKERPRLVDPASGVIATANNRVWDMATAAVVGFDGDDPHRARRATDILTARTDWTAAALHRVALDTRVERFEPARNIILALEGESAGLVKARALAKAWNGTADADQVGYRLVRRFAQRLRAGVTEALLGPAIAAAATANINFEFGLRDEPLIRVLEERPAHLVPGGLPTWAAFFERELLATLEDLQKSKAGSDAAWGIVNTSAINHPLAQGLPGPLARAFNMQALPQSGDGGALRVATATFGASMRMVISPGNEQGSLLHMPTGQSGNPASPHYRDMHAAWAAGTATPLAAGATAHTITLSPGP